MSERISGALNAAPDTPRERIAALSRAYLSFATTERGMFELMFRHDLLRSDYLGLRDAALPLFRLLVGLVAAASPEPSPQVVAGAIWAGLHGTAQLWNWGSLTLATGATDPAPFVDALLTAHLGRQP
ncbi:TetR-like C-terminal domain-containing protein [Actinoplanes sp. NPDC051851]|uniref:TetR-like C-terminal domain-containing protein n=1 Tax=Actinoplanes sp. NPDC051851 TaxID=3154753 RepID=UPI003432E548